MINNKYLSRERRSDTINMTQSHTRHIRQRASKRAYRELMPGCV